MDRYYLLSEKTLAKAGLGKREEPLRLPTKREPVQELESKLEEINREQFQTAEEKWQRYVELFNKYFSMHDKRNVIATINRPSIPEAEDSTEKLVKLAAEYVPKKFSEKAQSMARDVLSLAPKRWSKEGFLLTEDNQIPSNVNLLDLVDFAVRNRKNVAAPVGWAIFRNFLKPRQPFVRKKASIIKKVNKKARDSGIVDLDQTLIDSPKRGSSPAESPFRTPPKIPSPILQSPIVKRAAAAKVKNSPRKLRSHTSSSRWDPYGSKESVKSRRQK